MVIRIKTQQTSVNLTLYSNIEMISICIPVYNFKVDALVKELYAQTRHLGVPSEIILIDDGSEEIYREYNKKTCNYVKYIQLDKNIGWTAIRNLFLKYVAYDHLLFLDCDSLIIRDNFLAKYLSAIKEHPDGVICGGRVYDKNPPARNKRLRWKYGIKREGKSLETRQKKPDVSFMAFNFVISRKVFEKIHFDERVVEYGHEDTLFGFELKKGGIKIYHIDNVILNGHLETNDEYIQKTEKALGNLPFILQLSDNNKSLIEDVAVLRTYYKLYGIRKIIAAIFLIKKPFIKFLLSKGYVNLYLLDFYKLGILTEKFRPFKEHT